MNQAGPVVATELVRKLELNDFICDRVDNVGEIVRAVRVKIGAGRPARLIATACASGAANSEALGRYG